MIGVVFNHDMYDDPYKQTSVHSGFDKLQDVCDKLNEHLFTTINGARRTNVFGVDYSDEYVVVHHTCDLTDENKAEIADCIKKILELKKTVYKDRLPEIVIVFVRILGSDCICYNVD